MKNASVAYLARRAVGSGVSTTKASFGCIRCVENHFLACAQRPYATRFRPNQVVSKGRLGPGQMIACDLATGEFEDNWSIKESVAARRPYGDWLRAHSKVGNTAIAVVVVRAICGDGDGDGLKGKEAAWSQSCIYIYIYIYIFSIYRSAHLTTNRVATNRCTVCPVMSRALFFLLLLLLLLGAVVLGIIIRGCIRCRSLPTE